MSESKCELCGQEHDPNRRRCFDVFVAARSCPKCECEVVKNYYSEHADFPFDKRECINRRCANCGYEWKERPIRIAAKIIVAEPSLAEAAEEPKVGDFFKETGGKIYMLIEGSNENHYALLCLTNFFCGKFSGCVCAGNTFSGWYTNPLATFMQDRGRFVKIARAEALAALAKGGESNFAPRIERGVGKLQSTARSKLTGRWK